MTVTQISPLGYGTADSSISYTKQLASGELTPEIAEYAASIVTSGECLKPIDNQDDGCIDGRPVNSVTFIDSDGHQVTRPMSDDETHDRAKVAGGGYITSLAMQLGLQPQAATVDDELRDIIERLAQQHVYCGAHTGGAEHAASACGANEKLQTIVENAILYKTQIAESTKALIEAAGLSFSQSAYDGVIESWQKTLSNTDYFGTSTSGSRLEVMTETIAAVQQSGHVTTPLSVAKNLSGDHKEDFIIINFVDGQTFSQAHFAKLLAAKFPDVSPENRVQVFVVDAWRIVTLAMAVSGRGLGYHSTETAVYAGVMYQLATAATLTDGTLPVFIVQ